MRTAWVKAAKSLIYVEICERYSAAYVRFIFTNISYFSIIVCLKLFFEIS